MDSLFTIKLTFRRSGFPAVAFDLAAGKPIPHPISRAQSATSNTLF